MTTSLPQCLLKHLRSVKWKVWISISCVCCDELVYWRIFCLQTLTAGFLPLPAVWSTAPLGLQAGSHSSPQCCNPHCAFLSGWMQGCALFSGPQLFCAGIVWLRRSDAGSIPPITLDRATVCCMLKKKYYTGFLHFSCCVCKDKHKY